MGVPSLYRYIASKYPQTILKADNTMTDNLYLDFNAIIHSGCHPNDRPDPQNEDEMFKNILKITDQIINKIRPTNLIFISVDGVAPRAKLNQQRSRRYKTAMDVVKSGKKYMKQEESLGQAIKEVMGDELNGIVTDENINSEFEELVDMTDISDSETWDTNAITTGTVFMEKLDRFIQNYIQFKLSTSEEWKNLKVIYSGSSIPGEGEQKIMNYLRNLESENQKKGKGFIYEGNEIYDGEDLKRRHVIYSPDADLIFLTLIFNKINVKVLKEDLFFEEQQKKNICEKCKKRGHLTEYCSILKFFSMVIIDSSELKKSIIQEYHVQIKRHFNPVRMISDFIFLGFLAGNDFLPTISCFDVRFEAIKNLISLQSEYFNKIGYYITEKNKVNFSNLKRFLKILSKYENELYIQKKEKLIALREKFNIKNCEEIPLETEIGKKIFYKKKLNCYDDFKVNSVCKEYLKGLAWVFEYYISGNSNWSWFYTYHYAPFACDLARTTLYDVVFPKTKPVSTIEQLLLVLPPHSKDLIPEPLRKIHTELKNYYPDSVKIDMFDKFVPWQGIVLVPFIDIKKIQHFYNKNKKELNIQHLKRNTKESLILFINHNNENYKSILKNINELNFPILIYNSKFWISSSVIVPGQAEFFGKSFMNHSIGLSLKE